MFLSRSGTNQTLHFHSQIIGLREVFPHGMGFVLAFEFMPSDLTTLIRDTERPLSEAQVKAYMIMLLKGVAYMHNHGIMHRVKH